MADPLAFYQQIRQINEAILGVLDQSDLDRVITLLEERRNWMRAENCPTVDEESRVREQVMPLMEAILVQDAAIEAALLTRQKLMGEALQTSQRARIAQEYRPGEGAPEAKFMDREG